MVSEDSISDKMEVEVMVESSNCIRRLDPDVEVEICGVDGGDHPRR